MLCKCGEGGMNTGILGCVPQIGYTFQLIMVKFRNDAGEVNEIDCTDLPIDVSAKINDPDKSKRWYPLGEIKGVTYERAESITEGIDDINYITKRGPRTFIGQFIGDRSSPTYSKVLESFKCGEWAYFFIDQSGNLVGEQINKGKLAPIKIEQGTYDVIWMNQSASVRSKNMLSFTVSTAVQDSRMALLTEDDFDEDLRQVQGLVDVTLAQTATPPTTTEVEVQGTYLYGTACVKEPFTAGGDVSNWEVFNETQQSAVTLDGVSVVDEDKGIFLLDYQTQGVASADVLTVKTNLDGFESNTLSITIP